ncbi:MAG: cell division protein FtsK [Bacteroidetes bacterium GWF2_38_335]|nr:MAG: cell division protein FtsK [Bacteroidetes bacterium GWF2_38_335]OFY80614.1 MAG: cell division protein FtsK [Bacteroidetes bacterium RIFOXYA12_FULL_38_20]HBS86954.1 cell division protein FtsK [Bacteroidales bacterium]
MASKEKEKKEEESSQFKLPGKFWKDERFKFISGLVILFFSLFLLLAFISFLFTWKNDQSKLDIGLGQFISSPNINVDNWAGKAGALAANFFIHNLFGIAAFSFIFLFIIYGFKLVGIKLIEFSRTSRITVILTIWFSVFMGYLFAYKWNANAGGAHGLFVSQWINSLIGKAGTGFILIITLAAIYVFSIENAVEKLRNYIHNLFTKKEKTAEVEDVSLTDDQQKDETPENEENSEEESSNFLVTDLHNETDPEEELSETPAEDDIPYEPLSDEDIAETPEADIPDVKVIDSGGVELTIEKETSEEVFEESKVDIEEYDPTLELSRYKFPPLDLLVDHRVDNTEVSEEELVSNKNKIVETLNNYKIQIDKIKATIGPTVTLYEIVPAPGVRISKIKNLEDDIALSLSALGIRIIAPIPGKGTIGIEVPNSKPEIVSMKSVIASAKFQESKFALPVAMGKTISNETFVFDLAKMPHLLVAGATGQGKSVGLNAILTSLLYKKHPSQLKFVMVDPKKVELSFYSKLSRHYIATIPDCEEPIITDTHKVINTLNSLVIEMENRYELLKNASVREIKEYNAKFISRRLNPDKGHRYLPYIVVVIDEFADLIMEVGKEVETPIARIAQKARAVGIHLIIATQRPSANIITGVIKANFPARMAFKVASMIDSRTILDTPGANQLIGRGDLLLSNGSEMTRIQCAFIDTPEIENITEYIGSQQGYPTTYELPEYIGETAGESPDVDLSKKDQLFEDAARAVVIHQQGSTSLIQRKFSIGYNRAGRIIDQLEAAGIVGPFEGSKARQVLFSDLYALEQFLNNMDKQ